MLTLASASALALTSASALALASARAFSSASRLAYVSDKPVVSTPVSSPAHWSLANPEQSGCVHAVCQAGVVSSAVEVLVPGVPTQNPVLLSAPSSVSPSLFYE